MAEVVVSFVLEKLGELINGARAEAKFLLGVKEKVEVAKKELESIRRFLKDADARVRNGDKQLAPWVEQITDAAYDLDDVVSTFALKQEITAAKGVGHKIVGGLKKPTRLHKVGSMINEIFNRLSNLHQNLKRYEVFRNNSVGDASSSKQRLNDLRRTYSHVPEHDFGENEGGMMELVTQLTKEGNSASQVVSIHGMGGLGKTTLAKKVYHHDQVRKHFECFAWVFVSKQFQPKDIWKGLLINLVSDSREKKEIKKMEQEELAGKLYGVLQKQKCLVVLDDVWKTDDWDSLKAGFPETTTRSKILITTRRRDVGEHADKRSFLYQPPHLDDTASWELLKKKANFQQDATGQDDYENMQKLGKDMVKYCGGLPLAIVVLGGLLSKKYTVDEWKTVNQNVKQLINEGPSDGEQEHNSVSRVLGLSYDELPYLLKPCFLHLANFPEDYEINVKELCRLWTAEGFVLVEDEARKCLMDLVDRSMVQVGQRSSIVGRIKTCRIHDLMRDLCLEKAKNENFFHCIKVSSDLLPNSKVRRLAIHSNDNIVEGLSRLTNIGDEQCLRSLLCFAPIVKDFNGLMKPLFKRFNMLRVFKFECTSGVVSRDHQIPKEIGRLIHLRFLSFKDCDQVFLLPSSMDNLICLQTLDLRTELAMNLSPRQSMNVLSKLVHLKHLYLPNFSRPCLDEDGPWLRLGKLRSLETLVNFDLRYSELDDLLQLTKLTKLSIITFQALKEINPASNLQSLSVSTSSDDSRSDLIDIEQFLKSCPQIQKLRLHGKLLNSLENIVLTNLVKLTMEMNFLEVDPMPILANSKLRILVLKINSYCGKKMFCCKGGFPKLESLSIASLCNLEEWTVEEGALSKLCHLEMFYCGKLKSYPDGLRNITTLKEIKLTNMEKDFMRSFNQKERDED